MASYLSRSRDFYKSLYLQLWTGCIHQIWAEGRSLKKESIGHSPGAGNVIITWSLDSCKSLYLQFWMMHGYPICTAGTAFGEESITCSSSGPGGTIITCTRDFNKSSYLQLLISYIHQIRTTIALLRKEFVGCWWYYSILKWLYQIFTCLVMNRLQLSNLNSRYTIWEGVDRALLWVAGDVIMNSRYRL